METKVKICGITSVADAAAAVSAGADAIGLMFAPQSPRRIPVETAKEIAHSLPAWILRAGVFVDAPAEEVMETARVCKLNLLQFHGSEAPDYCAKFGVMTMKAFRIKDSSSLAAIGDYSTDFILLDSYVEGQAGGTGESFNWSLAAAAGTRYGRPVFLAGGLTSENVALAVRQARPYAVDVSSGVESAPGKKDPAKMKAFVDAVRGVR